MVQTQSLTLRPLELRDAEKIFLLSQERGMRAWLPSQVYPDRRHAESVVAYLVSQFERPGDPRVGPYVLGVWLRETSELIGHVGLSPLGTDVEVGFAIAEAHQRKGLASEAVRAVCSRACDAFSLPSIVGVTAVRNAASQRVLVKAGFERGREERMRFQGVEQDVLVFAYSPRRR